MEARSAVQDALLTQSRNFSHHTIEGREGVVSWKLFRRRKKHYGRYICVLPSAAFIKTTKKSKSKDTESASQNRVSGRLGEIINGAEPNPNDPKDSTNGGSCYRTVNGNAAARYRSHKSNGGPCDIDLSTLRSFGGGRVGGGRGDR